MFKQLVRDKRKQAGLSQTELGNKLGISRQAVFNWEKGLRKPRYYMVVKLANALHTEPLEFMDALLADSRSARRDKHGKTDD